MRKCYEEMYKNESKANKEREAFLKYYIIFVFLILITIPLSLFGIIDSTKLGQYGELFFSSLLFLLDLYLLYKSILYFKNILNPMYKGKIPFTKCPPEIRFFISSILAGICLFFLFALVYCNHFELVCNRSQDICYRQNTLTKTIDWNRKLSLISKAEYYHVPTLHNPFESMTVSAYNDPKGDFCGVILLEREPWISSLKGNSLADEMNYFLGSNNENLILKSRYILYPLLCFALFIDFLATSIHLFLIKRHFYISEQKEENS